MSSETAKLKDLFNTTSDLYFLCYYIYTVYETYLHFPLFCSEMMKLENSEVIMTIILCLATFSVPVSLGNKNATHKNMSGGYKAFLWWGSLKGVKCSRKKLFLMIRCFKVRRFRNTAIFHSPLIHSDWLCCCRKLQHFSKTPPKVNCSHVADVKLQQFFAWL